MCQVCYRGSRWSLHGVSDEVFITLKEIKSQEWVYIEFFNTTLSVRISDLELYDKKMIVSNPPLVRK